MTRRHLLLLPAAAAGLARDGGQSAQYEPAPEVRVVFGGDVMLARGVGRVATLRKDPAWPFRSIADFLARADLAFVNLESPFAPPGMREGAGMIFKARSEMVAGLTLAGIDVVSLANNHVRDCGASGIDHTLELLASQRIAVAGVAQDPEDLRGGVVLERHGLRFGFLAYTYDQRNGNYQNDDPRIALLHVDSMCEDVAALRDRTNFVVVSMHAGSEYRAKPDRQQVEFARAAIDAGASVVAGHHPHVLQPEEVYREGLIFYSLGNLVFDQSQRKETRESVLAEVIFRDGRISSHRLHPLEIRGTVPEFTEKSPQ